MTNEIPRTASVPSVEEVDSEKKRLEHRKLFRRTLRSTIYALIVVAAVSALLATLLLPVTCTDSTMPTWLEGIGKQLGADARGRGRDHPLERERL